MSEAITLGVIIDDLEEGTETWFSCNPNTARLTEEYVEQLYEVCAATENTAEKVKVEWINDSYDLDKYYLDHVRQIIMKLLLEMEATYFSHPGYMIAKAGVDKHDEVWTEKTEIIEKLFILGKAIEVVEFFPEKTWDNFPDRLPYVSIRLS